MSCVLGYERVADDEAAERVWVQAPGSHSVRAACKDELLAAMHELRPRKGARLVLLGTEVGALAEVHALLANLGGVDDDLLGKLPEDMTLYERRLAAYIRALLDKPDLLVVEALAAGLGPTKRRRTARFAELYQARCPGGTFVHFDG